MEIFTFYSEDFKTNLIYDDFILIFSPVRFKYKHIYIGSNPKGDYDLVIPDKSGIVKGNLEVNAPVVYPQSFIPRVEKVDYLKKKVEEVKAEDSNVENIFRRLQALKRSK